MNIAKKTGCLKRDCDVRITKRGHVVLVEHFSPFWYRRIHVSSSLAEKIVLKKAVKWAQNYHRVLDSVGGWYLFRMLRMLLIWKRASASSSTSLEEVRRVE